MPWLTFGFSIHATHELELAEELPGLRRDESLRPVVSWATVVGSSDMATVLRQNSANIQYWWKQLDLQR